MEKAKGKGLMSNIDELKQGLETAYIDGSIVSNIAYRPQFVSNNYKEGKKVFSSIEEELASCDGFQISVAFITDAGIAPLFQILKELEERNVPGKILTTNYLNFSEPKALQKLNEYSNIEIRMYDVDASEGGFHTKGYIFKKEEIYRIIIGSSNLTSSALSSNKEWNTKIVSTDQGEVAQEIVAEFNELWNSEYSLSFDAFYEDYEQKYKIIKEQREIARSSEVTSIESFKLKPNSMQVGFITNLKKIVANGKDRALLISATGTGKTYASAFAMREMRFKRVLFLVHRGQLARQTKKSYERVFGSTITTGIVGAGSSLEENKDKDYIFAMIQTMSKDESLQQFAPDAFDCIVFDEAHHAAANSYKKILDYFTPELWLGMTATPDKRDDNIEGRNIYEIFNYQIAYEIRLQQAMEENLLCPFHYFGIRDISIIGDDEAAHRDFGVLTSDERVKHILEQTHYYGYSGNKVKGLIFCSGIEESKVLSAKFNQIINPDTGRKFRTIALNGDASEDARQEAFERLAMDEDEATANMQPLDYIFSYEILNEGVDIVEVNQVVMLRPTQSPIVFIQQLGRGLRKAEGKEYVIIIDFIGNYNNNFMIPIALSGDRTYNKDNIRRYVMEGGRIIPGASTVHFDEISKQRIFESIDKSTLKLAMLKEKYAVLRDRLGRIPSIVDFYEQGEIDPMLFIEYTKESYHSFLKRVEPYYKVLLSQEQEAMLSFVSQVLANGKRPHELLILKSMLKGDANICSDANQFKKILEGVGGTFREQDYESALNVLGLNWINSQSERKKYNLVKWIDDEEAKRQRFKRTSIYALALSNGEFKKQLTEVIEFGLLRYRDNFKEADENNLVLYQKYSRKDVCRILNWKTDDSSTVYGYRYKYGTCPIFVTYNKLDTISKSTQYLDYFINEQMFNWMTRSRVSMDSKEAQQIIHSKDNSEKIFLFVKKSDDEGSDFYYMGEVSPIAWHQTTIKNDKEEELPIMNFKLKLKNPVREDLYEYLIN